MMLAIIFLPLLSFLAIGFWGRYLGTLGSTKLATGVLFFSFLLSCYSFYDVALNGNVYFIELVSWMEVGSLLVKWGFLFDTVTVVMLVVVTSVSFLVHLYSIEYMREDPHSARFFSYLSLFTFFMLILVLLKIWSSFLLAGRVLVCVLFAYKFLAYAISG